MSPDDRQKAEAARVLMQSMADLTHALRECSGEIRGLRAELRARGAAGVPHVVVDGSRVIQGLGRLAERIMMPPRGRR